MSQAEPETAVRAPIRGSRVRRRHPDRLPPPARRSAAHRASRGRAYRNCPTASPVKLRLVVLSGNPALAESTGSRDNHSMDPLVIALAQLVRDRWANEQRDRRTRQARLQIVAKERG